MLRFRVMRILYRRVVCDSWSRQSCVITVVSWLWWSTRIWITRLHGWPSSRRTHPVFYTPICYLFFAGCTHTREQMTANVRGIKNPVSLEARWSGRHLRLSPLSVANESLFYLILACVHARLPTDLTVVKVILSISKPCMSIYAHSHWGTIVRT